MSEQLPTIWLDDLSTRMQVYIAHAEPEELVEADNARRIFYSKAMEVCRDMKLSIADRCNELGGFDLGGARYYTIDESSYKCVDVEGTAHALLESAGGDFGELVKCLASQPWKHGAVRSLIGEQRFGELFARDEKTVMKEGKPRRAAVMVADSRKDVRR